MKIHEYNEMMAYLLRPATGDREKFAIGTKPDTVPNTQFAALADDLEPGSLKDEMLKDFDPSQETYEEYLQRKSLEDSTMGPGGYQMTASKLDLLKPKTYTDTIPNIFSKIKKIYQDTYSRGGSGMRKKIYELRDKEFTTNVKNILDTQYEGNLTKLSKDLNVDRATIFGDFNRHGIDTKSTGAKTIPQFNLSGKKLTLKEVTDLAKKDDQYLINIAKNKLGKNYESNKNKYVNLKDLAETLGIQMYKTDGTINPVAVDDLLARLNRTDKTFGLNKKKGLDGRTNYFLLEDTINKFQKHNLSKKIAGESNYQIKSRYTFIKKQDETGQLVRDNLNTQIRNKVKSTMGDDVILDAGENIGHSESVANQIQFKKLYKGSNVGDISSLIFQDPILNKNVLQKFGLKDKGTEQLRKKYLNILENLIGKKNTLENKKIATNALNSLNKLNVDARNTILKLSEKTPILKGQEKRIPDFTLKIPKEGETFKSGMLNIDTSKIDPSISVGKILEINPNAKKYDDLTKEQKEIYKENYKNQMADYLEYFYKKAKFNADETQNLVEGIEEIVPTKKYNKGGRVSLAEGSEGLPSETLPAIAAAAYKAGKPITNFAKGAFKTVISPAVASAFAGSEMMDINPFRFAEEDEEGFVKLDEKFLSEKEGGNQSLAGLDLLYPNIARALGSKITTVKNFYNTLLNMGIPLKYAPRLISGMTGVGLIMIGGDAVQGLASLAGPNKRGPLTEEELIEMENKRTAMPRMLDTYEQAIKIAKDENISYSEALEKLKK